MKAGLDKVVLGELKNTIDAHGPISNRWVSSAAKRISSGVFAHITSISVNIADEAVKKRVLELEQENGTLRLERTRLKKCVSTMGMALTFAGQHEAVKLGREIRKGKHDETEARTLVESVRQRGEGSSGAKPSVDALGVAEQV